MSTKSDQYCCSRCSFMNTGPSVHTCMFASRFPRCTQQEQVLCGLRCPEVVAAQRHRGGKHHLRQPFQQTEVGTTTKSSSFNSLPLWWSPFFMLCTSSFPGTKRWLTPALCSRTLTCCLSVTKLRSERGYAHHLASFAWICLFHFWPCFNVIVLLWLRASTWVEGRDRGSAWPELSTGTPTSSSWWAPQNNTTKMMRLKEGIQGWFFLSKCFVH